MGEISKIKVPKYLVTVGSIPRNTVGKFDMKAIHQLYGDGSATP